MSLLWVPDCRCWLIWAAALPMLAWAWEGSEKEPNLRDYEEFYGVDDEAGTLRVERIVVGIEAGFVSTVACLSDIGVSTGVKVMARDMPPWSMCLGGQYSLYSCALNLHPTSTVAGNVSGIANSAPE